MNYTHYHCRYVTPFCQYKTKHIYNKKYQFSVLGNSCYNMLLKIRCIKKLQRLTTHLPSKGNLLSKFKSLPLHCITVACQHQCCLTGLGHQTAYGTKPLVKSNNRYRVTFIAIYCHHPMLPSISLTLKHQ